MIVDEAEMKSLVGHRFAGGIRRVEHWENFLLTDCTAREQLPDGLVHPIALFHVPIQGAGTTIAELFELAQVADAGSVWLDSYDWEYFQPLVEDVDYQVDGTIIDVERTHDRKGRIYDRFVFRIDMSDTEGNPIARVTNHWRLPRAS